MNKTKGIAAPRAKPITLPIPPQVAAAAGENIIQKPNAEDTKEDIEKNKLYLFLITNLSSDNSFFFKKKNDAVKINPKKIKKRISI